MDDRDRRSIINNLKYLAEGTNDFNEIFSCLKEKGLFSSYMENEIMNKEDNKRVEFFYKYVTTRGPDAFHHLCEALRETHHDHLVAFLTKKSSRSTNSFLNGNSSNVPSLVEEFPFHSAWKVKLAHPVVDVFDFNAEMVYKMRSEPKGLALIINIRTFVNDTYEERKGSEHDVFRLKEILTQLGYVVIHLEDLTAQEMLNEMNRFAKDERHHNCDSSIVFVMSHGLENTHSSMSHTVNITGRDAQHVNSGDLMRELMAYRCEALRGKPKLFFFQACRGNNRNYPVQLGERRETQTQESHSHQSDFSPLQTDGIKMRSSSFVRNDSDIFIGNATSPGNVAMRDPELGSWYIQTLCRVFARHAWNEDIVTIMQYVDAFMANNINQGVQTPTFYDYLNRKFYFQPGIYDTRRQS